MVDIDLNANISKLSLIGSPYSFDETLDSQALAEVMEEGRAELNAAQNSSAVLKDFGKSFDSLLTETRTSWGAPDFKQKLHSAVANFSREILTDLGAVYETMNIKADEQINESDINTFADIDSPETLRLRVENIKDKFLKIKAHIEEAQA